VTVAAHAEHVGSLLRPEPLLEARQRHEAGELGDAALKHAEDEAVRSVVALQHEVGLPIVTDGELRRESFQSQFVAAVDGFTGVGMDTWLHGAWHSDELGDVSYTRPAGAGVTAPLRKRRTLAGEEFVFLRSVTGSQTKVTLPSPSLMAGLWSPQASPGVYPGLDDFMADVTEVMCDEAAELARLGCGYIQLDAPHYPLLVDANWRDYYASLGWPAEQWLAYGVELDNAVIDAAPTVTFGLHLCRGNQASRWLVAGDYEPIASQVLGRTHADRLLLEYDDERSGGFEVLDQACDEATVVLGLVSTKHPRLESIDELTGAVRRAERHLGLERLAVGTQCGFATSVLGNAVTAADERRKLALVVETAERVWGAQ
jgi:5-methyltetrahydropteroyltriglutamate--homocysteine methyltransferase